MNDLLKNTIENYDPANILFNMEVDGWNMVVYKMKVDSFTILTHDGHIVMSSIQEDISEFDYDVKEVMEMSSVPEELKESFRLRVPELSEYLMHKVWQK